MVIPRNRADGIPIVHIENAAFANRGLTSVIFHNQIRSIGNLAFQLDIGQVASYFRNFEDLALINIPERIILEEVSEVIYTKFGAQNGGSFGSNPFKIFNRCF